MIIELKQDVTEEQKSRIRNTLSEDGMMVREISDGGRDAIGAVGRGSKKAEDYEALPGVEKVTPISTAFKLVSRQLHPEDSKVQVGDVVVGGDRIAVIAGPCSVESREQVFTIAREVKKYGAVLFRGGAFKPRTSPYSFQGMEEEGLKILADVRKELGLRVVTEITSPSLSVLRLGDVGEVHAGPRRRPTVEK